MCILVCALTAGVSSEEIHGCSGINSRAVRLDDGWTLMRDDGKILSSSRYCDGGEFSGGLILFSTCGTDSAKNFVYLTPEGSVQVTINAAQAGLFSEGLAPFEKKKQWGYIDEQGKVAVAPRFDEAKGFSEGLAAVELEGTWHFVDRAGDIVLTPQVTGKNIFQLNSFRSGAALVIVFDPAKNTYSKGLIDREGRWLIEPTPDLLGGLTHGLAPFWSESLAKQGFVDRSGNFIISPKYLGNAELPFQDGLAAVYVGNESERMAGFIGELGQTIIPARYEDAYHFCDGLAPIKMKGRWGFIDQAGQIIIAPKYQGVESFDGGIAIAYERDGNGVLHQELINRSGSVLYRSSKKAEMVQF